MHKVDKDLKRWARGQYPEAAEAEKSKRKRKDEDCEDTSDDESDEETVALPKEKTYITGV